MKLIQRLAELSAQGKTVALCTVVETSGSVPRHAGSKMLVFADKTIEGTIGGGEMERRVVEAAVERLKLGSAQKLAYTLNDPASGDPGICGGTVEVFVEPITPQARILIVGAGHVGQALAHLADWLEFRVEVNDDRPDFCTPEMVPQASAFFPGKLGDYLDEINISETTYIVLSTRNMEVDLEVLPELLKSSAAYIGVIGSKRRWETAKKELRNLGVSDTQLERVRSPMGLEINAETPEEIALSILSEIVMIQRGGNGKSISAPPV
jgi:xanthine dehydrogenase accessory factor